MTAGPVRVGVIALDHDVRSVAAARTWLRDLLQHMDTPAGCIEQAVLVVSELASNAIRHGAGSVLCQLTATDGHQCMLTVLDGGDGTPGVVERPIGGVGGLGLVIVDRLAITWGVAPFEGGKAVYALLSTSVLGTDGGGTDGVD